MAQKINPEDYIGKRFGKLTILSMEEHTAKVATNGHVSKYCKCKCDCGNIVTKDFYTIKAGKAKSCGCLQKFKRKYSTLGINHLEEKCSYCGRQGTYAKGLCPACYLRQIRNEGVMTKSMAEIQELKKERERQESLIPPARETIRDDYKTTAKAKSSHQEQIYDLYVNQHKSQVEVAKILGISKQAVNKCLKLMKSQNEDN